VTVQILTSLVTPSSAGARNANNKPPGRRGRRDFRPLILQFAGEDRHVDDFLACN